MALLADVVLFIAALGAAFYCRMLAVRLRRLSDTDQGLGGAISSLSIQVDEMNAALAGVAETAEQRTRDLDRLTARADRASRRLELVLASLHETDNPPDGEGDHPETRQIQRNGSRLLTRKPRPRKQGAAR